MKTRRWPDVVIVLAIVVIGAAGAWVLWGEELGLRGGDQDDRPAPVEVGPGGVTS